MAIDLVSSSDPRFADLNRSKASGLWPTPGQEAAAIALCQTGEDVRLAVEQAVKAGKRPTIMSSGHCYEDFILNNPGGHIIDVRPMNGITQDPTTKRWRLETGASVGEMYWGMYSKGNVTIPAASCTSVGLGGHISGGGYGVLSRQLGISPEWVSAAEVVTVDAKGNAHLEIVDKKNKPDLLRALRGSGGGQFGVVTAFFSDNPPAAPKEVATFNVRFTWDDMTPERLHRILWLYGNFWATRGHDKDAWGIFTNLNVTPGNVAMKRPPNVGFGGVFVNADGTANDTRALEEFLQVFDECKPISTIVAHPGDHPAAAAHTPEPSGPMEIKCLASVPHNIGKQAWIDNANANYANRPPGGQGGFGGGGGRGPAPAGAGRGPGAPGAPGALAGRRGGGGGGGGQQRTKYKSAYMKEPFTLEEARVFHSYLTSSSPYAGGTVAIGSFGGATNMKDQEHEMSDGHRDAVMKLQFIYGWRDPAEDAPRIEFFNKFYSDLYSVSAKDPRYKGTPYPNDHTDGCYINYADASLTRYDYWPQLYWNKGDLVPFLKRTKKKYDPHNIFHHALSVKA